MVLLVEGEKHVNSISKEDGPWDGMIGGDRYMLLRIRPRSVKARLVWPIRNMALKVLCVVTQHCSNQST